MDEEEYIPSAQPELPADVLETLKGMMATPIPPGDFSDEAVRNEEPTTKQWKKRDRLKEEKGIQSTPINSIENLAIVILKVQSSWQEKLAWIIQEKLEDSKKIDAVEVVDITWV